ncbi:MAG: CopG family antitoxin [Bacillota bacterium]|jgi:predicted DNA binding CopG/RHH family protein
MPRKELPEFKGDEIPEFASEEKMAEFFDRYSFAEAMEKGLFEPDEVELAPELAAKIAERSKTKRVTLRLRVSQIEAAKRIAKEKDIPYQTLLRSWIAEAIRREQEKRA